MARPLRVEFENAIYHVCARGNARQQIFRDDPDRVRFLHLLSESAARFAGSVLCFALLGNHYHLLVQTRHPNLGRWMQWLGVSYTVFFNRRHQSSGHLFQGRYKSFLVQEGSYLLELSRYIHLNPVRGMHLGRGTPSERRERLRSFRWSSYSGYAALKRSLAFVEEEMVLSELGGPNRGVRLRYRRFVEEGLTHDVQNPFKAVRWQAFLGDESFVQEVLDRVKRAEGGRGREVTAIRRAQREIDFQAVLEKVAKKYKVDAKRLLQRGERGLEARNVAIWLLWQTGSKSLREIGELFGGLDYAAVAQRIRRTRMAYPLRVTRKLLQEMLNV